MLELFCEGFVRGTYKDKNGDVKNFTRIYGTYELDDAQFSSCEVCGSACECVFVGKIIDDINVGDIFSPVYNKFGTCVDIIIH